VCGGFDVKNGMQAKGYSDYCKKEVEKEERETKSQQSIALII
jgi:hypothetical protein